MSNPIRVDIWSDVQCPRCSVSKRRFEDGAAQFVVVVVEYHSFELAPDSPVELDGTPTDYLIQREGIPAEQVTRMLANVTHIAKSVGLAFERVHQTNTVASHELIHFAKSKRRQRESQRFCPDVWAAVALAREYGIQGVPFFVSDGRYGAPSAQDATTFANVPTQVLTERSAERSEQWMPHRSPSRSSVCSSSVTPAPLPVLARPAPDVSRAGGCGFPNRGGYVTKPLVD